MSEDAGWYFQVYLRGCPFPHVWMGGGGCRRWVGGEGGGFEYIRGGW